MTNKKRTNITNDKSGEENTEREHLKHDSFEKGHLENDNSEKEASEDRQILKGGI